MFSFRISCFLIIILYLDTIVCFPNTRSYNVSHVNFLENYGYLPKMNPNELNLISNEEFENALKLMQKFANIPQTGKFDNDTLRMMSSPRCALPDVMPEYRPQHKRSKRFVVYGPKWNKIPIRWSFTHPSRTVPTDTARRVFSEAWNLWSQASHKLRFVETSDPKADILIGFYTGNHGCGSRQAFDGPGIKLAHAFPPPNGDVHFDDDENWIDEKNGISLYWTALHEFGHALGFAHTADENSIMFPYYRDHGDNYRLPEVDKAGVRYLYGDLQTDTSDKLPLPTQVPKTDEDSSTTTEEPKLQNIMCHTSIDAIASIRNEIFVFKNKSFWWVKNDLVLMRRDPIPISEYFQGFPPEIDHVDAVYERRSDQLIMFFVGKQYWLFNANQYHDGPKPLTDLGLPEQIEKVDAVTDWGWNGRAYIFTGPVYWRLTTNEQMVQLDYPRDMSAWPGIPHNMDAAFTLRFDSATYFFKDQFYWRLNNEMSTQGKERIRDFLFRSIDCRNYHDHQDNDNNDGGREAVEAHQYRMFQGSSGLLMNQSNALCQNNVIIFIIICFNFVKIFVLYD